MCGIKTSPRTSKRAGGLSVRSCNGILRIVRILAVISSPVVPSPRVAAWVRIPFTYKILTAKPSSLGSQQKVSGLGNTIKRSSMRFTKALNSSSEKALSKESMGIS